jgi:hypothetical protein
MIDDGVSPQTPSMPRVPAGMPVPASMPTPASMPSPAIMPLTASMQPLPSMPPTNASQIHLSVGASARIAPGDAGCDLWSQLLDERAARCDRRSHPATPPALQALAARCVTPRDRRAARGKLFPLPRRDTTTLVMMASTRCAHARAVNVSQSDTLGCQGVCCVSGK